jgi:hypothetical protein
MGYVRRERAISHRALAGEPDVGILDVADKVTEADAAHLARSCAGASEHCGEGETAFRLRQAPGRVWRSGGDQDAADFGVALDVADGTSGAQILSNSLAF